MLLLFVTVVLIESILPAALEELVVTVVLNVLTVPALLLTVVVNEVKLAANEEE